MKSTVIFVTRDPLNAGLLRQIQTQTEDMTKLCDNAHQTAPFLKSTWQTSLKLFVQFPVSTKVVVKHGNREIDVAVLWAVNHTLGDNLRSAWSKFA